MLMGMPQDVQDALGKMVPSPRASANLRNSRRWFATSPRTFHLNGETIRLTVSIRMAAASPAQQPGRKRNTKEATT